MPGHQRALQKQFVQLSDVAQSSVSCKGPRAQRVWSPACLCALSYIGRTVRTSTAKILSALGLICELVCFALVQKCFRAVWHDLVQWPFYGFTVVLRSFESTENPESSCQQTLSLISPHSPSLCGSAPQVGGHQIPGCRQKLRSGNVRADGVGMSAWFPFHGCSSQWEVLQRWSMHPWRRWWGIIHLNF